MVSAFAGVSSLLPAADRSWSDTAAAWSRTSELMYARGAVKPDQVRDARGVMKVVPRYLTTGVSRG